jgi:hypothetical protein
MTDSYYRTCRHCGRRIQMRRMPAGQWVPFEGFDQVHDCSKIPPTTHREKKESSEDNIFGGVGFKDFQLKGKKQGEGSEPAEKVGNDSRGINGLDFKDFQIRDKGRVGASRTASPPQGRSGAAGTVPPQGQPTTSQTARHPQGAYSVGTGPGISKGRAYPSPPYRPKKSIWDRWGWLVIWAIVLFGPIVCGKILHH